MAGEASASGSRKSSKMPGSGKIQRSVSAMIKQMEMTDEEMKYRMENFENAEIGKQYLKHLKCTSCNLSFQNVINKGKTVGVHPLLGVLLCDSCCDYYGDGNFSMDSEGEDKYCRWCGQGGTIFACSKCICGFCDECIKKHFGKPTLEEVKKDDDWVCYFCNPRPLWYLRSICSLAKEAAKSKKEHLESLREGKAPKKKKEDSASSNSSDPSTSDSNRKKKPGRRRRFSRQKEKEKIESSSSSDEEVETQTNWKRKRKGRKKEESSGSEGRTPKKKLKMNEEKMEALNLEEVKWPLLDKLKSIWKLTQTATEVGLKSSRERLMRLQRGQELKTMESLRKEHEELKACIGVLVATLGVAATSANSIGENLKFDSAKDEREIFQSQEMELKRYEKRLEEEARMRTTPDAEGGSPSKAEVVEEKEVSRKEEEEEEEEEDREEREGNKEEKVVVEKEEEEEEEKERRGGKGEKDGGESGCATEGDGGGSGREGGEGDGFAKPLLKVKSFARMLEENVYDRSKEDEVNGVCEGSERRSPIVIDLYDMDTEESDEESDKKKKRKRKKTERGRKDGEKGGGKGKGKEGESGEEGKEEEERGRRRSRRGKDVEGEKVEVKGRRRRKSGRKKETSESEVEEERGEEGEEGKGKVEDGDEEGSEGKEEGGEEKELKEDSGEEEEKSCGDEEGTERSSKSEGRKASDKEEEEEEGEEEEEEEEKDMDREEDKEKKKKKEKEKKEEEEEDEEGGEKEKGKKKKKVKEKEKEEEKRKKNKNKERSSGSEENSGGNSRERSSNSEEDLSDGGSQKTRRITRNKKKEKAEVKVSFAEFKKKRERFLRSSKQEKKKVSALDSSDSEEEKDKNGKQQEQQQQQQQQKKKRVLTSSDEEGGEKSKEAESSEKEEESEKENQVSEAEEKSASETSSDEMSSKQMRRKRVRRQKSSDSSEAETTKKGKKGKKKRRRDSSSDSSGEEAKKKKKGRKNIKKILKKDSLQLETKEALKNEEERKKRLKERQKLFEELFPQDENEMPLKHLILDFDPETKEPLVTVHKKLVRKLKPHQARGVRFMWDNCFESVQRMEEDSGSGCILAHCMGLGKTLQVITLVHTVMSHDIGVNAVLVVCPLGTVANWIREFEMWLANIHTEPIVLYDLVKYKKIEDRRFYLKDWQESGGVLVCSYDLFRTLTKTLGKKRKSQNQKVFESALLDPGPDLVICDEGHLLKNEETALSKCMNRVKTSRRIILTGTPLQNNLIEYHCMVQFVKPNILGTKKEFCNRFVNPISNGQFEDSTDLDVKIMKRRSHVLHSMLDSCIQRFDYSVLTPFLPEKFEYVLSIAVTESQAKMYRHFISNLSMKSSGSARTASLFNDYHSLQRIWTHPRTLLMQSTRESMKEEAEGSLKDFIVSTDEESESSRSYSSDCSEEVAPRKRITRSNANDPEVIEVLEKEENEAKKNWWDEFCGEKAYEDIRESNKLVLLFALLKHCREVKDKVLVFSQSLYSLDLIEYFLGCINQNKDKDNELLCGHQDTWLLGSDYFRLDGSTASEKRANWCNYFNKESNTRARLFLLSTKAGGLGINLYGANRVVIFDASWNPSHDLQSIFRIYRFGQKKTCYVYRFLSEATMEEKIYERQVTKLSLAHRVVDEHQIERHYTMGNLQGLYTFEPTPPEARKTPNLPKDTVLADLLAAHGPLIVGYHEHDSLLENKEEEELSEEERKAAWKEYEDEKVQKNFVLDPLTQQMLMQARAAQEAAGLMMNSVNPGQSLINPMFVGGLGNIPLPLYQRGIKVGLTPLPNESLESFFTRIVNKEGWMVSAGQQ